MEEREIKQKLEKGYINARIIIEVVGKPKEHVEEALTKLIEHIRKNAIIEVLSEHKEEAKEVKTDVKAEHGLWGAFVEIEILVENLNVLVGVCFEYMPSSVEIIEPEDFKFKSREVASILNEIQGKLHSLGVVIKNLKNENLFLRQNSANLLINYLTILLVNQKRSLAQLAKLTTISEEELKPFIDKLLKDGKIKEEEGVYTFVKK